MKIESISASRCSCFSWCDFKYYLTYELGLGSELTTCDFYSSFGNSVHETLEEYTRGNRDWEKTLITRMLENKPFVGMEHASKKLQPLYFIDKTCDTCQFKSGEKCLLQDQAIDQFKGCPLGLYNEARRMVADAIIRYKKVYDSGIRSETNKLGRILGVEEEFRINLGKDKWGDDVIAHGLIDLITEIDDETIEIIDYKTGFKTQTTEELEKDIQAKMYNMAVRTMYPKYKYVLLSFDYFRGQPITITFKPRAKADTEQQIIDLWNIIKGKTKITRRPEDWVCKHLCNRTICDVEWEKLKTMSV